MNSLQQRIRRRPYSTESLTPFSTYHPVLQRIFAAREFTGEADLSAELADLLPFDGLQDIQRATERLVTALIHQQHILIVGDFDADGATSTVVTMKALRAFGASKVSYLVPNRFEYGYGLTPEIVALAAERGPDLIMTVDNGIASHQGVDTANACGIDVIITDHHLPAHDLPNAYAIVNPNRKDDNFASKNLAGVGVAFYLMLALRRKLIERQWFEEKGISSPNMAQLLDLVALGTVADVVPLDKNNRIIVAQGIQRIRAGKCCHGITALLTIGKRLLPNCVATDLGFAVAPRLNAAGRLKDMSIGIECLLAEDANQARVLALELDQLNQTRQTIEAEMQQTALEVFEKVCLDQNALPVGICLYDESWHQGISGIVAGRLKERYYRPTIIFACVGENELKGSARSVPGVHIRDLLEQIATENPGLIHKFGGHAMAAGLSITTSRFSEFAQIYTKLLTKTLTPDLLAAEILTDGQLLPQQFDLPLAEQLRIIVPWGQSCPPPLFDGDFKIIEQRLVGEKHLKLVLQIPNSDTKIDAIAFNVELTQWPNLRCREISATYRLDVNEYQGWRSLQIIVDAMESKDFQ